MSASEVGERVGRRHDQRAGLDRRQVARADGDDQRRPMPGMAKISSTTMMPPSR